MSTLPRDGLTPTAPDRLAEIKAALADSGHLGPFLTRKELDQAQGQQTAEYRCWLRYLVAELARLRGLIREVRKSGVFYIDPRIRYVEVQIDTDTWAALEKGGGDE